MSREASCRFLEWDSNFFGVRIARLEVEQLTLEAVHEVFAWCREQDVDCLYFLAGSADTDSTRIAEDHQFHLVDVRLTLEHRLQPGQSLICEDEDLEREARPAVHKDLPALRQIARSSFHDSRFYHDGNFPPSGCDDLYEAWVEASFNGYADAVLVLDVDGQPAGFITCKMASQGLGEIGLLGVGAAYQGMGIGRKLVQASLAWFCTREAGRVTVVTQGRNVAAQRLYQRCGFLTQSTGLWYHRWFRS